MAADFLWRGFLDRGGGRLVDEEPIQAPVGHGPEKHVEINGLHDPAVGPEFVGTVYDFPKNTIVRGRMRAHEPLVTCSFRWPKN